MGKKLSVKFVCALLCAVILAGALAMPAAAQDGQISTDLLEEVAEDYEVNEDFLELISRYYWLKESTFLDCAVKYKLPAQYVQRFVEDYFVFKKGDDFEYIPVDHSLPKNSYDWSLLVRGDEDHEVWYEQNGVPLARKGIDVSEFQGDINWEKVKAQGIDFAFIRLGYRGYSTGKINLDKKFKKNMENAINAGIQVGVYFYSQAITTKEAVEEAQFVLDYLDGYDIAYPVVFDIEGAPSASARTNKLTPQKASNIAIAFCDEIQQAGYETMVYSYTKYFVEKMDLSLLTQYNTWLAQYYEQPFFPYEFDIWQYTSTGKVNGIKGHVDMNLHFID